MIVKDEIEKELNTINKWVSKFFQLKKEHEYY